MYNEIFGVATFLVTFILMVIMFRCFGKQGLNCLGSNWYIIIFEVIKTVHILVFLLLWVM